MAASREAHRERRHRGGGSRVWIGRHRAASVRRRITLAGKMKRALGCAALALTALSCAAEVTLTWDLPTRMVHCVDSGEVLDRLEGTRVYRLVATVPAPAATWAVESESLGTHRYVGLSPRMRGSLQQSLGEAHQDGSIPAYAGEPGRLGGSRNG